MTKLFKTLFLMSCLAVMSACATFYTGEITDLAASEEKEITAANGDAVNVRVDIFARDTTEERTYEEPKRIGVRYISQITYTYPDGTVIRENVPSGDYTTQNGRLRLRSYQPRGENAEDKSGAHTVENALRSAWTRANERLGVRKNLHGDPLPNIHPETSVDAMLSAVDAATN